MDHLRTSFYFLNQKNKTMKRLFILLTFSSFAFFIQSNAQCDVEFVIAPCYDNSPPNCSGCISIQQLINGVATPIGPGTPVGAISNAMWEVNGTSEPALTGALALTEQIHTISDFGGQNLSVMFTYDASDGTICMGQVNNYTYPCETEGLSLSGTILRDDDIEVENVNVTLQNNGNVVGTTVTGPNGEYTFENLTMGEGYVVRPIKDINDLNGVTTFDLVLISQHILGTVPFTTSYELVAADVDKSGSITTFDVVQTRTLILQTVPPFFPNNTSWRFVPSDLTFPNFPNVPSFQEQGFAWNLGVEGPETVRDFIGVKIGDLNFSANPAFLPNDFFRDFELNIMDQKVEKEELITIPISVNGFDDKISFQFGMEIDQDYLEIVDCQQVHLPSFDQKDFAIVDGNFNVAWLDEAAPTPISFEDGTTLFNLVVKAKKAVNNINDHIKLRNEPSANLVFNKTGKSIPINLIYEINEEIIEDEETKVYQNDLTIFPNPVKDQFTITYPTDYPSGNIDLFTINGQLIKSYNKLEMTIDINELPAGVYMLQLNLAEETIFKKLIKQ